VISTRAKVAANVFLFMDSFIGGFQVPLKKEPLYLYFAGQK